jgi:tripartite-type tricarboxylate transporter receptor subunit TctC
MKTRLWLMTLYIFLVMALGISACTTAAPEKKAEEKTTITEKDEALEFYKGKTVRFVVPYSPGGGYDVIARSLVPYLEKYTEAHFIVENIPGAGGNVGAENVFKSKPDGLTIGILNNQGMIMTQLFDPTLIRFNIVEYSNIGRVTAEPVIMYAKAGGNLQSMEDVLKSESVLKVGMLGPGDNLFLTAAGIIEALDMPAELISGYPGQTDVELAVIRQEVDLAFGSVGSRYPMVEAGEIKPLIFIGGEIPKFLKEKIGDVPSAKNYVTTKDGEIIIKALSNLQNAQRGIMGPPGIPEDRRLFLENALLNSLSEPKLIEEWEKAARIISFLPGNEYKNLIKELMNVPEVLSKAYNDAVKALE